MDSSKTRNQMLIGTTIGIFVTVMMGALSSFQPVMASIANQGNATSSMTLPIADISFYREHITVVGQNPINATHVEVSLSGKGNLTLPNSTQTIAVNSTGTALVNFDTTSVIAQQFLTTAEDGSENASATIYEITRHDVQTRTEKGVVIAIFETNSTTGHLAFLDGMIAVGQADVDEAGNTDITLREFETGIPYVKNWMELLMMMSPQE
jgi:hypothetical protein